MRLFLMLAACRAAAPPNVILVDLIRLLQQRGHRVDLGIAQDMVIQPGGKAMSYDLFILKSHSNLWLSLAGVLHQQGARILNPFPSCSAVHNKIVATQRMQAAGIPIPETWVTGDLNLLSALAEQRALVVKPYIGGRGRGVCFVQQPVDLQALPPPIEPVVVQEFVPGAGEDLKVYVIHNEVFAVRKPYVAGNYLQAGIPAPVSAEVRQIALNCGRAFGMGLYGLDIIEGPQGPVVVDLNYFPSYRSVPGAAELLADYIVSYAYGSFPDWVFDETLAAQPVMGEIFTAVPGPLL